MISRTLSLVIAASVGLTLSACSGDPGATTTTAPPTTQVTTTTAAPTTTTTTSTTTTTLPPTTTTSAPEAVIPYPDNRGDDWLGIVTGLSDFIQWLDENPDPELVSIAYVPGTPRYEAMYSQYEGMVAQGVRDAPGDRTETVSVEVVLYSEATETAIVDVVDTSTATTRIDSDGNVVEEFPSLPLARVRRTLIWDDDAGWRVAAASFIEEIDSP